MSFFFDQKFLPKIWLIIVVLGVVFFHFFPFVQPWSMPVFLQATPKDGFVQSISLIPPVSENKAPESKPVITPLETSKSPAQNLVSPPPKTPPNTIKASNLSDNTSSITPPVLVPEQPNTEMSTGDLVKAQTLYEQELKKAREEKLAQMAQSVASEARISSDNLLVNFEKVKIPSSRVLKYKVQAVNVIAPGGAATLTWVQDSSATYQLNFEATAAIIYTIRWNSQGFFNELGLAPNHFIEKRFRSSETAAHFDYENQLISFSKKEAKTAMLPGAQDRFSVVIQLASIIAADPDRFKAGQNIVIQVANSELAEAWVFNVLATESLTWSGKSYETLRLQRQARKPYDAQLELWLAKDLEYMPVRIKQTPVTGAGFDAIWMGP